MKIALCEKKFKKTLNYQRKLLRLIKEYNLSISVFTQWSTRFGSVYSVTLFLSISMIFLHSPCSSL